MGGTSAGNFVVARYSVNGRIDSSFGSAGRVVTDFGAADVPPAGCGRSPRTAGSSPAGIGGRLRVRQVLRIRPARREFCARAAVSFSAWAPGRTHWATSFSSRMAASLRSGPTAATVVVARLTAMGEADASFGTGGAVSVTR